MAATDPPRPPEAQRVSFVAATTIVIGNMIGTGVFTSLGFQVVDITSWFPILLIWTLGGLVAFCGAVSYAELASALPRSGGEYHFLSRLYHPLVGFLAGWISVTVGFAAPVALAAMAFGTYFARVFPAFHPVATSLALLAAVTVVFLCPLRIGSRFLGVFVLFKVFLILLVTFSSFGVGESSGTGFFPAPGDFGGGFLSAFAISLIYVMYSYSGWNASTYVVNEIDDPQRTVPRSLMYGTLIVTLLYVAVNAAFLYSTPIDELRGQLEVGLIAGRRIFGESGGDVMALLICIGLVSTISAMTWAGPRVAMVMGEDYRVLRVFGRRTRRGIPWVAVLWQFAVAAVLLLTSTFEAVITYIELILILSSAFTVLGVFLLRRRQGAGTSPYRTWGYPVTPAIFLLTSLFILVFVLQARPTEALFGGLTLAAGAVVYWLAARASGPIGGDGAPRGSVPDER